MDQSATGGYIPSDWDRGTTIHRPGLAERFPNVDAALSEIFAPINRRLENIVPGGRGNPNDPYRIMTILNALSTVMPGPKITARFSPAGYQNNVNPSTGYQNTLGYTRSRGYYHPIEGQPTPDQLRYIMRNTADNQMMRPTEFVTDPATGQRRPSLPPMMRVHNLDAPPDPLIDNMLMMQDRLLSRTGATSPRDMRGGPGGNVMVPANRTPTQDFNAALIVQDNPELARHLGLLRAIRGD